MARDLNQATQTITPLVDEVKTEMSWTKGNTSFRVMQQIPGQPGCWNVYCSSMNLRRRFVRPQIIPMKDTDILELYAECMSKRYTAEKNPPTRIRATGPSGAEKLKQLYAARRHLPRLCTAI